MVFTVSMLARVMESLTILSQPLMAVNVSRKVPIWLYTFSFQETLQSPFSSMALAVSMYEGILVK